MWATGDEPGTKVPLFIDLHFQACHLKQDKSVLFKQKVEAQASEGVHMCETVYSMSNLPFLLDRPFVLLWPEDSDVFTSQTRCFAGAQSCFGCPCACATCCAAGEGQPHIVHKTSQTQMHACVAKPDPPPPRSEVNMSNATF